MLVRFNGKHMKPICALVFSLVALVYPQEPQACSCASPSLESTYSQAPILMLIEAGEGETVPATDSQPIGPIHRWTFRVLELFKGEPTFSKLSSRGGATSCGAVLVAGEQYLVIPQADGYVTSCGAWHLDGRGYTETRIAALRAALLRSETNIPEPMYFNGGDEGCNLFHGIANGGGSLQFVFRSRTADEVPQSQWIFDYPDSEDGHEIFTRAREIEGVHPSHTPGYLALWVSFPSGNLVKEGSGRVVVGESSWPTHRAPMPGPYGRPMEVVIEADTREALRALEANPGVSIHWSWHGLAERNRAEYPNYPEASSSTPLLYLGDGLERFRACVDRGAARTENP